jgi:MYXO-CTERM domain-containing protein
MLTLHVRVLFGILTAIAVLHANAASANAIYSYDGNPFEYVDDPNPPAGTFDTTDRVTGSFELASALAPNLAFADISGSLVSWSFDNGRDTITSGSGVVGTFLVSTDATGDIDRWEIEVWDAAGLPTTVGEQRKAVGTQRDGTYAVTIDFGQVAECAVAGCGTLSVDAASNSDVPGTWTLVPEPASGAMAALGLVALGARRRRRQSPR